MEQIFVEVRNRTFLSTLEISLYNFFWIFPLTFPLNSYEIIILKAVKKEGGLTCFLVKCINLPMYVFVLVKSELFKTASYSWAVLTTAVCCLYTCGHLPILLKVLIRGRKFHMSNLYVALCFFCLLFIVISLE